MFFFFDNNYLDTTGNISQQGSTITIKCPQDVKTVYKDCNKVQVSLTIIY